MNGGRGTGIVRHGVPQPGREGRVFEQYTEKARRAIFFARYEASHRGKSGVIEPEHLLLGMWREAPREINRLGGLSDRWSQMRRRVEKHLGAPEKEVPLHVDIPISDPLKRVLVCAAEEAQKLGNRTISAGHLALGILHEEGCFAAQLLRERGANADKIRKKIAKQLS
jgi:ATP-dependent Clp protease ATP-binding subunit ClpC